MKLYCNSIRGRWSPVGAAWIAVWFGMVRPGAAQTDPKVDEKAEPPLETQWSGNLLQNGSFEGEEGWSRILGAEQEGEKVDSEVSLDDQVARSGRYSVRLSGNAKTTRWFGVESEPMPVRAGNSYRVTGWIRTDKVHPQGDQFFNSNLYVQFRDRNGTVILIGRSPVRATEKIVETKDWTQVSLRINAPNLAEFARVGCALTCSGIAWFDDLGFYEAITESFNRRESSRFVFYFLGDDAPKDDVVQRLEKYLESTEAMLGVKRKERIRYFKYPDELKKFAMTGNRSASHFDGADIHATSWEDRIGIVGVLMNPLGATTELLARGLGVYCATLDRGGDVHEPARRLAKAKTLPPLTQPAEPGSVNLMAGKTQDAMYGSFVGWLIDSFDVRDFKRVYAYRDAAEAVEKMPTRFKDVYQISLPDAERRWKEFLLSDKPKP